MEFDLSLARGLDYYTGVIYEAVLVDGQEVGSISAGGRYDNLVGMFGGSVVPAVGFSIGVERIFSILESRVQESKKEMHACETDVLVVSMEKDFVVERMKVVNELWNAGIRAETVAKANPKIQYQLNYANTNGIPFAIIFGKRELENNELTLKNLTEDASSTTKQETFPRGQLIPFITSKINAYHNSQRGFLSNNNK